MYYLDNYGLGNFLFYPQINQPMYFNLENGQCIKTLPVVEIKKKDGILIVETINKIYNLTKLKSSSKMNLK